MIESGLENITFFAALLAGILSFVSPCILPIIPGYISLITELTSKQLIENKDKKSIKSLIIINSLFFIMGFTIIFILFQVVLTGIQQVINPKILNFIFGIIVIIFGLNTIGIFKLKFLYYQKKFHIVKKPYGIIGSFLIGMAFGFAWTPCVGQILAGILGLANASETFWKGTTLLLVYSAGLGIPFLLTGIFLEFFLKFFSKLKKSMLVINIISGLLLILIGIFILQGSLNKVVSFLQ